MARSAMRPAFELEKLHPKGKHIAQESDLYLVS